MMTNERYSTACRARMKLESGKNKNKTTSLHLSLHHLTVHITLQTPKKKMKIREVIRA
jgi:hypothetical protein